jgi:hypothetical protein
MMDPRLDNHGFKIPTQNENNAFQLPPQLTAPSLANPPPQYFGGYTNDGMPNINLDLSSAMFEGDRMMDDTADAKRRRIARVGVSLFCGIYSTR